MVVHQSHLLKLIVLAVVACAGYATAATPVQPWTGSWAFELPDGNPAWLRIGETDGKLTGELLWSVGSAKPVDGISIAGDTLQFHRNIKWWPFGESIVKLIRKPMTAKLNGKTLVLTATQTEQGKDNSEETIVIKGKRMLPMPPRPDLKTVKFGEPIKLFNGRDLTGWHLSNPKKNNGWRAENDVLINETPKKDFSAYGSYGNLVTDRLFEDFHLAIEYNAAKDANSGIYLRGMYEAQVVDRDSRMQGIQGPGAIFGRIEPSKNAGKPGKMWNRYDLILVDRHITVKLNGETVIDNQPLVGCTGGGISADDTQPGPIFLQGDHTSIRYRNIILRPVTGKTK